MDMPPNIYKQITRLAESEIQANITCAAQTDDPFVRYGYERQAIGIFQYWQRMVSWNDDIKEDNRRLSSYLSGPNMPEGLFDSMRPIR